MTSEVTLKVGGAHADDLAAFARARRRAEAGDVSRDRTLSFESWQGLAAVLTGERYRLLRHLHAHAERSANALA